MRTMKSTQYVVLWDNIYGASGIYEPNRFLEIRDEEKCYSFNTEEEAEEFIYCSIRREEDISYIRAM
ncbi:MAG: hypothetical protein ACRDBY_08635 [Cetobacterium sp.]